MKLQNILLIAAVLVIPCNVWAYGDNTAAVAVVQGCVKR